MLCHEIVPPSTHEFCLSIYMHGNSSFSETQKKKTHLRVRLSWQIDLKTYQGAKTRGDG